MAEADRDKLKRTFDQDAELYDKARPDYPEQIFDHLFALGGLAHNATVLELGCGTGDLLAALEPSLGVGVDFAPELLKQIGF